MAKRWGRIVAAVLVALSGLLGLAAAAAPAGAQSYGPASCSAENELQVGGALDATLFAAEPVEPGRSVPIFLNGRLLTTVVADATGNYTYRFRTPGTRTTFSQLRGVCLGVIFETCGQLPGDQVAVNVRGGRQVIVESTKPLAGFATATVFVNDLPIAQVPTDANGNWRYQFTSPGSRDTISRVSAACASVRSGLVDTGLDVRPMTQLAVGLIAVGATATVATKRRPRRSAGAAGTD